MSATESTTPLRQQLDYYRARAPEYDQWWLRQGRYDRGAVLNTQWFADAAVLSALAEFRPAGRVLEFACGTGIWSEQLLPFATHLTALDGSPEMLTINAARLRSPLVRYVEADLFQWQPTEQFDTVFFSFWLSHVPVRSDSTRCRPFRRARRSRQGRWSSSPAHTRHLRTQMRAADLDVGQAMYATSIRCPCRTNRSKPSLCTSCWNTCAIQCAVYHLLLRSETTVSGTKNISVPLTVPPDCIPTDVIGKRSLGFARP